MLQKFIVKNALNLKYTVSTRKRHLPECTTAPPTKKNFNFQESTLNFVCHNKVCSHYSDDELGKNSYFIGGLTVRQTQHA